MMKFYLHNATNGITGVRHSVNHIIGMKNTNVPVHPQFLSRLPVFLNPQLGCYVLEMVGVYEVVSEYYSVHRTEEDCYEIPLKRVYTYYVHNGEEALQEVLLEAVPDILLTVPFFRAVEHLDGMAGTCWREV